MKTITIPDDLYRQLKKIKRKEESFSDVIRRLLERRNTDIGKYFGVLRDSPVMADHDGMVKEIRESARSRA
ncbi:MAG: antitoxin VapB family protein [Candidatus Thorarchaeota archaeon]